MILKKEPLIKIFDLKGNHRGGFFTPIGTDDMVLNILANTLLLKKKTVRGTWSVLINIA
ncbi:MAG: hypothetical protein H5U06_08720 [Candidatus Aminicenantes bacterium]|nr:hypothetical protein [Candidatus Aminicenantes bacterium]